MFLKTTCLSHLLHSQPLVNMQETKRRHSSGFKTIEWKCFSKKFILFKWILFHFHLFEKWFFSYSMNLTVFEGIHFITPDIYPLPLKVSGEYMWVVKLHAILYANFCKSMEIFEWYGFGVNLFFAKIKGMMEIIRLFKCWSGNGNIFIF